MGRFSPKSLDLDGKVILITGGTGSFGRRFIETVLRRYEPRKVIVYSRDELKQSDMQIELREQFDEATVATEVTLTLSALGSGDVRHVVTSSRLIG